MADEDAMGGLIGLVLVLMAVVIVLALVSVLLVYVLLPGGAIYGAVTSLRNYVLAFSGNVKPERVTP